MENQATKRLKSNETEDRISALPDSLIRHILSLLPSIKDVFKTGVLSKRWRYQWTCVPILNFHPDGMSIVKFSNFVDRTLISYSCYWSSIETFVIRLEGYFLSEHLPSLTSWICLASERHVKELILNFSDNYTLPQSVFDNSSPVTLELSSCVFMRKWKANCESLKNLQLYQSEFTNQALENVLSACPLLEWLDLRWCHGFEGLLVDSKSLKTVILECLVSCGGVLEISCPNLGKLKIVDEMDFTSLKLKNLQSSVDIFLDFFLREGTSYGYCINVAEETCRQVQHVEKLQLGPRLMEILSFNNVKEDRISALPDSVIHHILTFLPSKQEAV